MSILAPLPPNQRTLIVSLPYRVGVWVSRCDNEGGQEAEDKERLALESIIDGFARDVFGSTLLQEIVGETLARKDEWRKWEGKLERIPAECQKAVSVLESFCTTKDIKVYTAALNDIAETVALAFQEQEPEVLSFKERLMLYGAYGVSWLEARLHKTPLQSFDYFLRVSPKERLVLKSLAKALKFEPK